MIFYHFGYNFFILLFYNGTKFPSLGQMTKGQPPKQPREYWSSRIGIILAVMGSAIGLGNFLRFPGLAARYGSGSFLIPYAVSLLILGLPIAWAEWSIGRSGGKRGFHSSPGIFHALWKSRYSAYLGGIGLLIPVGIFMYYVFIEAWCLYYAFQYLSGGLNLGQDPSGYQNFFASFIGSDRDGSVFGQGQMGAVYAVLICYVLNFIIIYRGVSKGIEKVSRYAIPVLFFCGFVVLLRVLTMGTPDPNLPEQNVNNGLGYMWNPGRDGGFWLSLLDSEMWLAAAGQIFFSLSVGFGIIINYSSYLRENDDVLLSGTTSAAGNIFAEVALGGMITIPAAFIFLGEAGITDSSFALGFVTLPNIFAQMPLGQFVGFLWFFLLFIAALTSSLSMLQPAIAFFQEGLRIGRRIALVLLGFISVLGTGFIMYFSRDSRALDTIDFWIGTAFIYIFATIIVIFFGWVIGAKEGLEEAQRNSLLHIPSFFAFILKYISPLYLLIIFFFWLYEKLPYYLQQMQEESVARYSVLFILLLLIFFSLLVGQAQRRWRNRG